VKVLAGIVKVDPNKTEVGVAGADPEPPPAAYEIVLVSASQVALRVTLLVTFPVSGYVALAAYVFVPSLQPANEYPVREKGFAGTVKVEPLVTEVGVVGADPEPPPSL
jgi:hypothetical protein